MGRVPQGTRSPYGHSQKRLTPMAWCRHFSYVRARASTAPGVGIRWDARSAFPLRALAKAPYADGVMLSFFLCPRSCKHGAGCGDPVGRALRVPPTGMSTTICLRGRGSPVGRAERVPPTGTRKSSRAAHLLPFICAHISTPAASDACANEKQPLTGLLLLVGAGGRTRTDTDFTPQDFESSASANFTTPAHLQLYHATRFLSSTLHYSARARLTWTQDEEPYYPREQLYHAARFLSSTLHYSARTRLT